MNVPIFFHYQAPPDVGPGRRIVPEGEQEIELLLDGFADFYIDEQTCRLGPGDFIRFQPGDVIRAHADREHPYHCCVFHLPEEGAFPFFRRCGRLHSVEFARAIAGEAAELSTRNRIAPADLNGWLGIFHQAQRTAQLAEETAALPPPVARALNLMRKELRRKLTVARIATAAGVSAPHLFALFRQSLGISPLKLLNNLRLEAAGRMLAGGTEPIKEIARICGFPSVITFGIGFKQRYGYPPGTYRRLFAETR